MYTWLACMLIGTAMVAYGVTHCPPHAPPKSVRRMEAVANVGFLLLLLGAVMICWRWLTVLALLPK